MSLKKQYLKTKNTCKVTFRLPKEATGLGRSVCLVGDFNNWNQNNIPMKKLKDGSFTVTIDLETGKEYQFRYLIDGKNWINDWNADKYVPSPHPYHDNSVVIV